ncbi:neural cell adhesion molecule 1-B-like [Aricia agestis]|uniref:neural cell adhesion molecule 1-B-like n=1 Tax=Aricia agestis TaxID=91739 RepID=UPI001C20BA76|nr:neural cell adhesion molecule 1-B-like [Aricia agestis]
MCARSMAHRVALFLLLCLVRCDTKTVQQDKLAGVRTVDVQAVEGMVAQFPCDLGTAANDKVYMVFWFRDDAGIPLYSFDVRGKHLSEARHWSAPEVFGPRAHFVTSPPPASLLVRDVKRRDEGVYRCRIDFRNTQTTSFRYNLTVVVPPEKPVVVDRWGRVINTTTLGPHEEGDDVLLTCRVLGGRPEPSVRWLVNGVLVDEEYEHNTGDVIENRLLWPAIRRADYAAVFTCQAANSHLVPPKEVSLVLDMFLKPLTVEIKKPSEIGEGDSLTAERRYEVACESAGSRPPAVITWYKGKRQLKRITEELRDNLTVSVMSFVPTLDDDGKPITCRSENPNVTTLFMETSWTISVVYPPVVKLRLGSSLAAGDIKEGDDVYFECHVRANPPARKLSWLHDDRPLAHNASARVFHSNQSLVLQKVTRHSSGRYACSALNAEGETVSNELHFRVKYAPSCRSGIGVTVVGAARGESVPIVCEVDADPPAAVFKWKFNNSGETLDVAADRYTSNGSASSLKYTPVADLDYGTLSCSASNEVGTQLAPCVFQMVAAGKPHALRNCTLWNQTADSVEVSCVAGFDGGLPQHFLLELYSEDDDKPRVNLTSEEPSWTVRGLEWEVRFRLAAVAVNSKGRSPVARLDDLLFRDPEKRTASEGALGAGAAGAAGATVAGAGAALALAGAAWRAARRRRHPRKQPPASPRPKTTEHDDAEPDLIPNNYCDTSSAPCLAASSPGRPAPAPLPTPASNGPGASWAWGSSTLRAPADLNVDAIKEKLLDNRIPESCV